jgi:RNA polymerase sigma-70 factor, ECF subfamily
MLQPAESEDELYKRMRAGDGQAFTAIYRQRQGSIYRYALRMSGSHALAEDVVQEVFMALMREGCGFDSRQGTLGGYLYGIARKVVLRQLEHWRRTMPIEDEGEPLALPELAVHGDPLAGMAHRQCMDALQKAVAALPRFYREVVVLCDLEEVDYAEAARILECPIGTVRSRLHRARGLLFAKLAHERGEGTLLSRLKPARSMA